MESFNIIRSMNFIMHKNSIPKGSSVTLKVYDITGREVKTLINEYKQSGSYETEFDASLSARQGNAMSSGVY